MRKQNGTGWNESLMRPNVIDKMASDKADARPDSYCFSGRQQLAPRNTRECFAHDFASDRCVVVGLPSKPPPVTESEIPT